MPDAAERLSVVLDAPELGSSRLVGTLIRWPGRGQHRPVSFAYDEEWLGDDTGFDLDPRTVRFRGNQDLGADNLPPVVLDTTPDTWGQMLLSREFHRLLSRWEMLVNVSDDTRMGALRFAPTPDASFVRAGEPAVPPFAALRELQDLARLIEDDPDVALSDARLRDLVLPGSSLGGARPKANVCDTDGSLWIAKFPSREDRRLDIGGWEFVYAELAQHAGIDVPDHRLEAIGPGRGRTFLIHRFDRTGNASRRLFASAMTLTDRRDGEAASYPDIVAAIKRYGARGTIKDDLAQLFRRLLFNVVAGNRDDHLRNHAFLRTSAGWRLAPAFDMNPARPAHAHSLSLDGESDSQDLITAYATYRLYGLDAAGARSILEEVIAAVSDWDEVAAANGIGRGERELVAPSFTTVAQGSEILEMN